MKSTLKTIVFSALTAVLTVILISQLSSRGIFFNNSNSEAEFAVEANDNNNYRLASNAPSKELSNEFNRAAESSIHQVVYIQTEFTRKSSVYDNFFSIEDFFYGPQKRTFQASGSGVIVSSDGYIVTNNHVVQDADKITITLNDKRTYTAQLIGTDPNTDLALLKIEENKLPYVLFGNSDSLMIGEWVLAVGNPFNLNSTVTAGIVSAKARDINILGTSAAIESFIQTDAVVNKGNSGGALVNLDGELVGINAAIASGTGYYTGYSFAIPSNIVRKIITDLKNYGTVQRAYLGITISNIDSKIANDHNFKEIKGVMVQSITDAGTAESAGIKVYDVITEVNGNKVNSKAELLEKIALMNPGDKITLKILRDNVEKTIPLELKNLNGDTKILTKNEVAFSSFGAEFTIPDKAVMNALNIKNGVQIDNISKGAILNSGIKNGFIIQRIDKKEIITIDDVKTALSTKKGGVLIEGIYPNGIRAYYGVGLQ